MRKINPIVTLMALLLPFMIKAQWVQISTIGSNELRGVKFFNELTGIVVGQGGIWRSTNSGVNWTQILSGVNMNSLAFPDMNNGFAVGDTGKIYRTFDNGQTWSQQVSGIMDNLYGVFFYNVSIGLSVGQNGKILKTLNGGSSWIQQVNFSTEDLFSIHMSSTQNAFAVGGNSNEVIATTANGGTNWLTTGFSGNYLKSGTYISNFNLMVCGGTGRIRKSTNSGASWTIVPSGTNNQLNCAVFVDPTNGFICGNQGIILKSTDGGNNWTIMNNITSSNLRCISFIGVSTGWAVGSLGAVLRMGIPVGNITGEINEPEKFIVHQNYPNPFNSSTILSFDIEKYQYVNIKLYDAESKLIRELYTGELGRGNYTLNWNANDLASGTYFIVFATRNNLRTLKTILIK